jgi:hypothetical protein
MVSAKTLLDNLSLSANGAEKGVVQKKVWCKRGWIRVIRMSELSRAHPCLYSFLESELPYEKTSDLTPKYPACIAPNLWSRYI